VSAEQELRDLVEERVRAVRDRDSATLAARPADDVITFDVLPPLNTRGNQSSADHLQQWFDGYDGPIDYTVRDVHVSANDELGFCSFLYHVGGTLDRCPSKHVGACDLVLPSNGRTLAHCARP